MCNLEEFRRLFVETVAERVTGKKVNIKHKSVKEMVEPEGNSLYLPYSSEMQELLTICEDISSSAKMFATKLEEYSSTSDRFYSEELLKENYDELKDLFNKFLMYKNIINEIIAKGSSNNNNESGIHESEDDDKEEDFEKLNKEFDALFDPLPEETKLEFMKYFKPEVIKFISNPPEAVQLAAVAADPSAIRYIKNPSEKIQFAAMEIMPSVLKYIDNPSEKVQLFAVQLFSYSIKDIKNPSEEVQLTAVKQDGDAIEFIKNPSEAVQLAAVENDPEAIEYIKNPYPSVVEYVNEHK